MGGAPPRQQTILIVDDEVDILESLKQLFEVSLKDVNVATAEGGAAALAIIKSQIVDLIVTDYKMPGMNGCDLIDEARRLNPRVHGVLMTGFAVLAARDGLAEHDHLVLHKPFNPARLLEQLRGRLDVPA